MILPALMHNFSVKLIDCHEVHYLAMQTIAMILRGTRRRGANFGLALVTVTSRSSARSDLREG